MTKKIQLLIFIAVLLAVVPAAGAQSVTGVYEHFTVGKGSGDLEGMRGAIFRAGAADAYHAIVQIAGGGAADPEPVLVDAAVEGKRISFTAGELKYSGTVTVTRLVVKNADRTTENLKRVTSASFFR